MTIKQVIVIRTDLKMRRGKEVSQGGHSVMAFVSNIIRSKIDEDKIIISECFSKAEIAWMLNDFTKICLRADSEMELLEIFEKAKNAGLQTNLITDSGKTEFKGVPTNTCLSIGPDFSEKIDKITGHLKLY